MIVTSYCLWLTHRSAKRVSRVQIPSLREHNVLLVGNCWAEVRGRDGARGHYRPGLPARGFPVQDVADSWGWKTFELVASSKVDSLYNYFPITTLTDKATSVLTENWWTQNTYFRSTKTLSEAVCLIDWQKVTTHFHPLAKYSFETWSICTNLKRT